jgi:hypothetical protein
MNTTPQWALVFQRELVAVLKRTCQCEGRNVAASTKRQLVPLHKHSFDIQIITEGEGFLVHGIQGLENYVS